MSRPRRVDRLPLNGWIAVDKPLGVSSAAAVGMIKRAFRAAKAGHAGTLDPLASGVLPMAFGEATKTMAYVMDGTKTYRFTLAFGAERTTDDLEGEITARSDARPSDAALLAALPQFVGLIQQVPPAFSAIKVDGARAYDLARSGETVELAARPAHIDALTLIDRPDADHALLEMVCGKGVYVRSVARDLGRALGCFGHVATLRRTRVGRFDEACAIPLDSLEAVRQDPDPHHLLLPILTALDDIPALAVTEAEAMRIRSGQAIAATPARLSLDPASGRQDGAVVAVFAGQPVALGRLDVHGFRPDRVFNL